MKKKLWFWFPQHLKKKKQENARLSYASSKTKKNILNYRNFVLSKPAMVEEKKLKLLKIYT